MQWLNTSAEVRNIFSVIQLPQHSFLRCRSLEEAHTPKSGWICGAMALEEDLVKTHRCLTD